MVFFFEGHFSLFTQDFLLFIFDQATFSLFSRVSSQQSPRFTIGDCRFSFLLSFMLWAFLLLFICSGHVHAVSFISFSVSFPIIVSSLFPITLDCITLVLRSYCKKFSSLVFLMSFFYPWIRSKFWCTRYWFIHCMSTLSGLCIISHLLTVWYMFELTKMNHQTSVLLHQRSNFTIKWIYNMRQKNILTWNHKHINTNSISQ